MIALARLVALAIGGVLLAPAARPSGQPSAQVPTAVGSAGTPPRLIGDLNTPYGDNSQFFSPETGVPAIQVPIGYPRGDVLPAGLTFFGRAWAEPTLIRLAFANEQATQHRRAPTSTPHLRVT